MRRASAQRPRLFCFASGRRGRPPHTVLRRQGIFNALRADLGDDLDRLTDPALSSYLARLRAQGLKPVTVWTHYNHLRTFFASCVEAGLLAPNPLAALDLRRPRDLLALISGSVSCRNPPDQFQVPGLPEDGRGPAMKRIRK